MEVREAAAALAKLRHQKNPRPIEDYKEMGRKSGEARRKKREQNQENNIQK